jgi:hypothetical protein
LRSVLVYTGLVVVLVFWAIGGFGLVREAMLTSEYNANCVSMFPLRSPPDCTNLTAQIGDAGDLALLGGVVGLGGLVMAFVGRARRPEL